MHYEKGDISNVVTMETFLMSVDIAKFFILTTFATESRLASF